MAGIPPLYALDIETDTSGGGGLDPRSAGVVSAALMDEAEEWWYFTADPGPGTEEARLLAEMDAVLATLPPGLLVGWNTSVFDLPFLVDRSKASGVTLGVELSPDSSIVPKYDPLPGHDGGYQATWHGHRSLDIAYELRDWCAEHGVVWSLKPCARAHGIEVVEVDREAVHLLPAEALRVYNLSDVRATLVLATRWLRSGMVMMEESKTTSPGGRRR